MFNVPSFSIKSKYFDEFPALFNINIPSLNVKFASLSLYITEFVVLVIVPVIIACFNVAFFKTGLLSNDKLYKSE
ncbi:unknown [Clostridium sp. CAG:433]|nr:unknown [Clostridium sp. CAG:433]